jgi:hypothetical protein
MHTLCQTDNSTDMPELKTFPSTQCLVGHANAYFLGNPVLKNPFPSQLTPTMTKIRNARPAPHPEGNFELLEVNWKKSRRM